MVASTVALLLVASGFVAYEVFTYRQTMTRDLTTLAEIIGDRATAALTFENVTDAEETLGALSKKKHIVAGALYDAEGHLFAKYPRESAPALFPSWPEPNGARFEPEHLVLFREIRLNREVIGTVYLKSDLLEPRERFERYAGMLAVFTLASLVVTFVLSSLLQRIITRPVLHLAETARAVSVDKNYTVRANKQNNDELGQLVGDFNEMLSQIQERDAALQESNEQLERRVWARTQDLRTQIAERERAESALQQQFSRISLLNQITQAISERQDTDSILHVVLRQLEDHLGLDMGGVALFDLQADTLNLAALRLRNPLLTSKLDLPEGTVLPFSDTGLQLCIDGQTVYVPDTLQASGAAGASR